jgi:PIN domain nuclease of toxin-antitoxin system
MRLLLDANVVLWMLSDPQRLTKRARRIVEDDRNELFFSLASVWEVAIKIAKGKLIIPGGTAESLLPELQKLGVVVLPIDQLSIFRTQTLPQFADHKDPFDRILVAQAVELGLTILTGDSDIPRYSVPVIWH